MAIGQTQSYSAWMAANPQLVQPVVQRYGQQQPPAQAPAPQVAPQQVAPVQATDTERVPMAGGGQAPAAQVQPAQPATVGQGAQGAGATVAKDNGNEGAINLAKTVASFWTGGAAQGIMGAAGGSSDRRMQSTMEPGAEQKGSDGGGLGNILGIVSSIKGMGGGGGGK